jgi:GTPase involved in cell partitioning and DNA repair
MSTLLDFRYKRKYAAQCGANGQGRNMSGKRGENLEIFVPSDKLNAIKESVIYDKNIVDRIKAIA